jgi:hypothetical protein
MSVVLREKPLDPSLCCIIYNIATYVVVRVVDVVDTVDVTSVEVLVSKVTVLVTNPVLRRSVWEIVRASVCVVWNTATVTDVCVFVVVDGTAV